MQAIDQDFAKYLEIALDKRADFLKSKGPSAHKKWRAAADANNPKAAFLMAKLFELGIGITKNEAEAMRLYRQAADQGLAQAQNNLGAMYLNGIGVQKDETEALKWYHKAADQDFVSAQKNLGMMYEAGTGIQKDDIEAAKWYRKAAHQGDSDAQARLRNLLNPQSRTHVHKDSQANIDLRSIIEETIKIVELFEFIKFLPVNLAKSLVNSMVDRSLEFAAVDDEISFREFLPFFPFTHIENILREAPTASSIDAGFTQIREMFSSITNGLDSGTGEEQFELAMKAIFQDSYGQILTQYGQRSEKFRKQWGASNRRIAGLTELRKFDASSGTFHSDKFRTAISRIAELIVKADGIIKDSEKLLLAKFKKELFDESENSDTSNVKCTEVNQKKAAIEEMNALIGLDIVKKEIQSLVNYLSIQKQRKAKNLPVPEISYHFVFTGAPGTGKTTVARIIGKILSELGFLKQGHLVEAARQDLVAGFVGQTALKTSQIIDSAMDGILFIDEAYTLAAGNSSNDYGQEAIDTLLKRMEDDRGRLSVIVAGYSEEMTRFIQSNPGLQSRFSRYINFEDYKPAELYEILASIVTQNQYALSVNAKAHIRKILDEEYKQRSKNFGNGRFVRNLFQKAIQRQADRIVNVVPLTDETLITLTPEDFSH